VISTLFFGNISPQPGTSCLILEKTDESPSPTSRMYLAITVITDGGWSKRTHKHSYNAAGGVAIIIGKETKKLQPGTSCLILEKTDDSPSPTSRMYLRPCLLSASKKPSKMISPSIDWLSWSQSSFSAIETDIGKWWHDVLLADMLAAGQEERRLAIERQAACTVTHSTLDHVYFRPPKKPSKMISPSIDWLSWSQFLKHVCGLLLLWLHKYANHICKCYRTNLEKLLSDNQLYKGRHHLSKTTRVRLVSAVRCAIRIPKINLFLN
jgi:hypothetical protein